MSALSLGAWLGRPLWQQCPMTKMAPAPPRRVAARKGRAGQGRVGQSGHGRTAALPRGAVLPKLAIVAELSAAPLVLFSLFSLMILVSLFSGRKSTQNMQKKRPPGPRRLPFIGSLHHLLTPEPQVTLRDLAKKHGPVMYLRLGQVDAVVISSPAAAQVVLRDHSINFASRPSILATEIMCYGNIDMGFSPYGAYWRMLRKLCTVELLGARKVKEFAPIRDSETMSLVRNVQDDGRGGKQPVNLGRLLVSCANMITTKATFGGGCDAELQERFLSAIQVALDTSGGVCIGDVFPSLRFVDDLTGLTRRLWEGRRQLDAVFDEIIDRCEARREVKKTATVTATGDDDLLSVLLRVKEEGELELPIDRTNIKAIIIDMFTAGTETTSSTAEWIMSELIRNPEVLAKAQEEVRRTLDGKNPQDHEVHMDKLSYLKMVIKEGLRMHPPVPLLLPRVCKETCDIGGFEITEGSRVMVNVWAIGRMPEHWHGDPEKFRPERFEDSDVDYNGMQYEYLPFGSGRRICPGANFGLGALEYILARLLYYYDWSLPGGIMPYELNMDMVVGAASRRRNQLHLIATPYNVPTEIEV